jgi:hypothetical protein
MAIARSLIHSLTPVRLGTSVSFAASAVLIGQLPVPRAENSRFVDVGKWNRMPSSGPKTLTYAQPPTFEARTAHRGSPDRMALFGAFWRFSSEASSRNFDL